MHQVSVYACDVDTYLMNLARVASDRYMGIEKQTLVVEFDGFKIGRVVSVSVRDPVEKQLLPSSPYQRTNAHSRYQDSQQTALWVVPGRQVTRCS